MERFGDRNGFLAKCNPCVQAAFAKHPDACFFGDYPTLAELNNAYGKTMASQWLYPQLTNLSEFSSAHSLLENQIDELSRIIAQEYHWLKVTELLLFFYRFKVGYYGKFYGSVDPLVIMTAIREFIRERNIAYRKHEQAELSRIEKEREKTHPPISREEWEAKKTFLIITAMYNSDYTTADLWD